jgi:hypothetical protein
MEKKGLVALCTQYMQSHEGRIRLWTLGRWLAMAVAGLFVFAWFVSFAICGSRWSWLAEWELPVGNESSFVVDSQGRIYWGLFALARIQVYDRDGRFLRGWAAGTYGKPFEIIVDESDRIFVNVNRGATIRAFERDGTYVGRWTAAELLKVKMRPNQRSLAGDRYDLGPWSTFRPTIIKCPASGNRVVVQPSALLSLFGVPLPSWPMALAAIATGVLCEGRLRRAKERESGP